MMAMGLKLAAAMNSSKIVAEGMDFRLPHHSESGDSQVRSPVTFPVRMRIRMVFVEDRG